MNNTIWISWQYHRRTEAICNFFQIEWFCLVSKRSAFFRYSSLMLKTFKVIFDKSPEIVVVQNPSLILCIMASLMKKLFKFKLIMDAHNEGVVPYVNDNRLFVMLTNYTHKASDLVIVTNENLLKIVEINGGNGFVLPDSLPAVPTETERQRFDKNALAITVINTFAKDEPLQEILDAVAQLGRDVRVFVTGNYKGSSKQDLTTAPDIVTFTGFLSEERYWERLVNSDIIIDLTSMKDCLVCGSYEAIAAGVPVLLSDDASARKLFTKGVVFTRNDAESIRENLRFAVSELEKLTEEIKELKLEYQSFWTSRAVEMKAHLTSRENNQR